MEETYTQINQLKPNLFFPIVKGKVTAKSNLRSYNKGSNSGEYFNFELKDISGRINGITYITDHFAKLQEGKTYRLSKIIIRENNFSGKKQNEIYLHEKSIIEEQDDLKELSIEEKYVDLETALKQNNVTLGPEKSGLSTQNLDLFEADEGNTMFQLLNEEQSEIAKRVLNAVKGESEEKLFFLEAPGGCGKTLLFSCLLCILRGQNQIALAGAWTGIASLLMKGGTTLHRLFGLPVPVLPSAESAIELNSEKADILRKASLFLIDEASIIPAASMECIDKLLRNIMKNESKHLEHAPFGGKVILFSGDFRQVSPVVP